jgi:hypothetical protein
MVQCIEQECEEVIVVIPHANIIDNSSETYLDPSIPYAWRPRETKWDPYRDPNVAAHYSDTQLLRSEYNSHAVRLCFDCMVIPCMAGSIRCECCAYKRQRRVQVQVQ